MEHALAREDALLRRFGYRVRSRPMKGEAVWVKRWRKNGKTVELIHTHSEALAKIQEFLQNNRPK